MCTTDQELADAVAHAPSTGCVCTHQMAALSCVKWCSGCHPESMTSYPKFTSQSMIEQFCQISSQCDLKPWSLGLLLVGRPNKKTYLLTYLLSFQVTILYLSMKGILWRCSFD